MNIFEKFFNRGSKKEESPHTPNHAERESNRIAETIKNMIEDYNHNNPTDEKLLEFINKELKELESSAQEIGSKQARYSTLSTAEMGKLNEEYEVYKKEVEQLLGFKNEIERKLRNKRNI